MQDEFRTFAHEVALQIAANSPQYIRVEDIPEEVLSAEREDLRNQAIREGKKGEVIDRIIEGRLQKYYEEKCLFLQPYIRDEDIKIEDLLKEIIATIGENIVIRRFVRWEVGEELE